MNNYLHPQTQLVESLFIKKVAVILMKDFLSDMDKISLIRKEYMYMAGYTQTEDFK